MSFATVLIFNSAMQTLQLDDATAKSIPSAVFYTDEDKVTCINKKTVTANVLLGDVV